MIYPAALFVFLKCFRLFAKRNIFFNFRLTFPGKEVYNCFWNRLIYHVWKKMAASTLIFNSLATRATVSNLGLLWQVSKSMIVRAFILSRSANFLCVKCCRLRSDRTFHANKSRGLFTIHHLYLIVWCAIAHINNHTTHIVWVIAHNLKQRAIWTRVSK